MNEKNLDISLLLDFYGDILTEKQRSDLELYYNDDLSLAEIAEHTQITRQGVRDSIKRGEAMLFGMEEKLGLVRKFRAWQDAAAEITRLASEIEELNSGSFYSHDTYMRARRIQQLVSGLDL